MRLDLKAPEAAKVKLDCVRAFLLPTDIQIHVSWGTRLVFTCSSRPACYPLLSLEVLYVFVCLCLCMIVRVYVYVYIYVCTGSSRRACCALFNLEAAGADSGRTAHLVGRRLLHIGPAQNQHRPMQAMNPIHIRNLRKIKQRTNLAEKKCGEYLIFCIVLLEKVFLSTFSTDTTPII